MKSSFSSRGLWKCLGLSVLLFAGPVPGDATDDDGPRAGSLQEARLAYYNDLRSPEIDITPWLPSSYDLWMDPEVIAARREFLSRASRFVIISEHWYTYPMGGEADHAAVLVHGLYIGLEPEQGEDVGTGGFLANFYDVWYREDGRWKVIWLLY